MAPTQAAECCQQAAAIFNVLMHPSYHMKEKKQAAPAPFHFMRPDVSGSRSHGATDKWRGRRWMIRWPEASFDALLHLEHLQWQACPGLIPITFMYIFASEPRLHARRIWTVIRNNPGTPTVIHPPTNGLSSKDKGVTGDGVYKGRWRILFHYFM